MPGLVDENVVEVPDGVVVERAPGRLRLRATADVDGFASGWFAKPSVYVELAVAPDAVDVETLGFAFTQFAMPVIAGRDLDFDFAPAPNLHSPPAVGLLLVRAGDRCTLLAPVTNVHEQVLSVEGGALRWGWHGDLESVPSGFETTLGIYDGGTPHEVFERWARDVLDVRGVPGVRGDRPPVRPRDNPVVTHLSYWTDNGAAYWYRTEPGRTIGRSVVEAVEALRRGGVPVYAVELDSWFYPHETARPITEIGYPEDVPPTGMLTWTPRADAFDDADEGDTPDGVERIAGALGHAPLILHSRHVDPTSPYVENPEQWWVDLLAAQPKDPAFFASWFDDAVRWGACCIEQDWMLMYWFGVRALRAQPGRALAWQRALDRYAAEHDIGLLWCMATPADMIVAASLERVVALRTSDDYRFAADPARLWTWFLTVNRVAGALGLPAFKDCFFSHRPGSDDRDPIDGDPHAEVEALLSALSAGPVGIGDRIGHTDREIVLRTCDADGRIRAVDRPLALVDDCLFGAPARGDRLAWATTTATRGDRVWTYVVALNTSEPGRTVADTFALDGEQTVYDWRARATFTSSELRAELEARDWALYVLGGVGHEAADPGKYVVVPRLSDSSAGSGATGVTRPSGPRST